MTAWATVRRMKVLKELKDFITKGNVVDLAVAVVIAGAFAKIVGALVADMVMPLVNAALPQAARRCRACTSVFAALALVLFALPSFAQGNPTFNNSGYASGLASADQIAGKALAGGGQVGYSRQLLKDAMT